MDVEVSRHVEVDQLEEREDVFGGVLLAGPVDHLAGADVQGGEEIDGAVALVVVCHRAGPSLLHRKARLAPLAVLMALDYFLTVSIYHYSFAWQNYLPTWAWYVAAMVLGQILLKSKTTVVRVGAGALLGPTSFFLLSNYAVWTISPMYPHNAGGLGACLAAGLPFYRNDLISTTLVAAAAFGVPVLVRRMQMAEGQTAPAK